MPIYEFLCEGCGRITEVMQKVDDPPPRSCGECGGERLAKLVSHTAFQLKGGGWYADLYGPPGKKGAREGEKSTTSAGGESPAASAPAAAGPAGKAAEPPQAAPAKAPGKKGGAKKDGG